MIELKDLLENDIICMLEYNSRECSTCKTKNHLWIKRNQSHIGICCNKCLLWAKSINKGYTVNNIYDILSRIWNIYLDKCKIV